MQVNALIAENLWDDSNLIIAYFGKEEITAKYKSATRYFSFSKLRIWNCWRLTTALLKDFDSFDEVYISDPYFFRLYTIAIRLCSVKGKIHLLDDGNTSILLLLDSIDRNKLFFWRLFVIKKVFRHEVIYSGNFIENLKSLETRPLSLSDDARCVVIGSSIVDLGFMDMNIYIAKLAEIVRKYPESYYVPHPIERITISHAEEMGFSLLHQSALSNEGTFIFVSFVSSLTVELALSYTSSKHTIVPISPYLTSRKLRREYSGIEKAYCNAGIQIFS